MKNFHADDYVDFLERVTPGTVLPDPEESFGLDGSDCPAFEGVFRYSAISAGGSLEGAAKLGQNNCDIAINWSGGLHHAMKSHASGFCYINGKFVVFMLFDYIGSRGDRYRARYPGTSPTLPACSLH